MKFKLFGNHDDAPVLSGPNPGPDELAIMQAGATGPGSETEIQSLREAGNRERLDAAFATGALVARNSVINTGEIPVTPLAPQAAEGDLGGGDVPAQASAEQSDERPNIAA
jgi:hypothetical protein